LIEADESCRSDPRRIRCSFEKSGFRHRLAVEFFAIRFIVAAANVQRPGGGSANRGLFV
jgi:hypothetical protein